MPRLVLFWFYADIKLGLKIVVFPGVAVIAKKLLQIFLNFPVKFSQSGWLEEFINLCSCLVFQGINEDTI